MQRNKIIFLLVLLSVAFTQCRKKAMDDYYERPSNLEPPIYQVLEAKGGFTNFLAAVDKAGYKHTLSNAGYWTLFAPNDAAFQAYFTANGITGIGALDSAACRRIVNYSLVYYAYKQDRISDFQSNLGWVPNTAFKRRTSYYTGIYNTKNRLGQDIKAIASNRNNNGVNFYVEADNNYKNIPYFETDFMTAKGLSAFDYNYFYPTSTYSGFNVADANVIEKDIPAENGVIHIIDKVISALPSLDQYIESNPKYSKFKEILDKFLVNYVLNPVVSQNYKNIYGVAADIYTKVYANQLAFSPNNENFLKFQDNDAQQDSYTMFVPENAALNDFIDNVLLEHFPSLESLPINVIYDLINAHMWRTAVWPSKFSSTFSAANEEARFDPATDITDKKILSNGIFYGTTKVQDANVFTSVYGKAYLDPNYSMMTSLLNLDLKFQISNIHQKYTLFLISNAAFNAAGYFVDPTVSNIVNEQWRYTPPNGGPQLVASSALVRLQRILNMHVVPGRDIIDLNAPGVALTYSGEFIKYGSNTVIAAGNRDANTVANVVGPGKIAKNGTVYYLDRILEFSEKQIGQHIEALGIAPGSEYRNFWEYLKNSSVFNTATYEIQQVAAGSFYTFFIPDNASIVAAVNAGLLPGTGTAPSMVPNFNPTAPADREKVTQFIQYHILNKKSIATDGQPDGAGTFETLYKLSNGDATNINVTNAVPNNVILKDVPGRSANIIVPSSNVLSTRCVIHLINNYLKYN